MQGQGLAGRAVTIKALALFSCSFGPCRSDVRNGTVKTPWKKRKDCRGDTVFQDTVRKVIVSADTNVLSVQSNIFYVRNIPLGFFFFFRKLIQGKPNPYGLERRKWEDE